MAADDFAVGAQFIVNLHETGKVSMRDLRRLNESPDLLLQAAIAIRDVVDEERRNKAEAHARRAKVLGVRVVDMKLGVRIERKLRAKNINAGWGIARHFDDLEALGLTYREAEKTKRRLLDRGYTGE